MSKVLVEFRWYCGRMGTVQGLFVTTTEQLAEIYGKEVYFGEILGKHSEVSGVIKPEDFTIKSTDPVFIAKLVEIIGGENISGYNPFGYLEEDEDEDDEAHDDEDI